MNYIEWCIEQHRKTNHSYDTYLPYEFHLRMVYQVYVDFANLLPTNSDFAAYEAACFGHDLIEDTRVSYNDVCKELGEFAANIIYAVTNEKGKNRSQRANGLYYKGIRDTEGAVFVKLCDRIANVQYSKMTKSRMFEMYKKENNAFIDQLEAVKRYPDMAKYLCDLFKTTTIC